MTDYDNLKLAHELAQKIDGYYFKIVCGIELHFSIELFNADNGLNQDESFVCHLGYDVDDLIAKLLELTEDEEKLTDWETAIAKELQFNYPTATIKDWKKIAASIQECMKKTGMIKENEMQEEDPSHEEIKWPIGSLLPNVNQENVAEWMACDGRKLKNSEYPVLSKMLSKNDGDYFYLLVIPNYFIKTDIMVTQPEEPKTKYKLGQRLFMLSGMSLKNIESFTVDKILAEQSFIAYYGENDGWGYESELYPTKQALIEAQLNYWEKLYYDEQMQDILKDGRTCPQCNQFVFGDYNCPCTMNMPVDSSQFCTPAKECQHESDGWHYGKLGHHDPNPFEGSRLKCLKCGEFYR